MSVVIKSVRNFQQYDKIVQIVLFSHEWTLKQTNTLLKNILVLVNQKYYLFQF